MSVWCGKFAYIHLLGELQQTKNYRLLVLICIHYNFEWVFTFQFVFVVVGLRPVPCGRCVADAMRMHRRNSTKREIELNFIMIS